MGTKLAAEIERFKKYDFDKLYRISLGDESIKAQIEPTINRFREQFEIMVEAETHASAAVVGSTLREILTLNNEIDNWVRLPVTEFIKMKNEIIDNITKTRFNAIQNHWQHFYIAWIEKNRLLGSVPELEKQREQTISDLKQEIAALKSQLEQTAKIQSQARQTAEQSGLKAAQDQFQEAVDSLTRRNYWWAGYSFVSLAAFFSVLSSFVFELVPLPKEPVIYVTALRLALLAAIGALVTFCLRIYKANLHLREHNLHRKRLANSLPAFKEAGETPEQRDLMLSKLVDAIAVFGTSGLLSKEDDSINPTKTIIENLTRSTTKRPSE